MNIFLAETNKTDPWAWAFPAILLVGLVAMMVWSAKRRTKVRTQVEKMLDELRPGVRIRTVGGIIGRIKEIREESPAHKNEKGVQIPAVKTVLLQTGPDKQPTFLMIDIQAIYGIIAEEGHTIEGLPIMKLPSPEKQELLEAGPAKAETKTGNEKAKDDFSAREYVDKRNALEAKDKKKK